MRTVFFYWMIPLVFLCFGCSREIKDPAIAQMRMRKMQSRVFIGQDGKKLAKEVLTILQDEGYIVKTASAELGLITAEKDINIEKFSSKFWSILFSGRKARWKKHSAVEITINITDGDGQAKIRVNYLLRVFDNLGRVVNVEPVLENDIYMSFFSRLQRGILAQKKTFPSKERRGLPR